MHRTGTGSEESTQRMASDISTPLSFKTPYDDLIPETDDPSAQFYLDVIRLYLAICSGTVGFESAMKTVEHMKGNPEFAKSPTDPTLIPVSERLESRIIENLKTLKRYNLYTLDSIKSAYSFAFLAQDHQIGGTDYDVLKYIIKNPLTTLVSASEALSVASRTISRSLDRIKNRYLVRFSGRADVSAFGLKWVVIFFRLREGVEWQHIEDGLSGYPCMKNILKTSMTDLGYFSVLYPESERTNQVLLASLKALRGEIFEYVSVHVQDLLGSCSNLDLLDTSEWDYPGEIDSILSPDYKPSKEKPEHMLLCKGLQRGVTSQDFVVLSQYQSNIRDTPSTISKKLGLKGWEIDPRQVSYSLKKINSLGLVKHTVTFGGLGLAANFCFEIICEDIWKRRIIESASLFPLATYFGSPRGIILWIQVPSSHQVDYYRTVRNLEKQDGVRQVNPIMTIAQRGSRSMLDLTRHWKNDGKRWTISPSKLNLTKYIV